MEFARVLSEELDLIPTFLLIIYLDLDVNNTFKNAKRASVSSSWRHMLEIANNRALAFIGMWLGSDARKVVRQRPGQPRACGRPNSNRGRYLPTGLPYLATGFVQLLTLKVWR